MGPVRRILAIMVITATAGCASGSGGTSSQAESLAPPSADLPDFIGPWAGHTRQGQKVERAATLLIEPNDDGGFVITWASFEAGEAPGAVERRERKLHFRKTSEPNLWLADAPTTDPFSHIAAWARITGETLRIDTLALHRDGRLERQVYNRRLDEHLLKLTYRRYVEGELIRTLEAGFVSLR